LLTKASQPQANIFKLFYFTQKQENARYFLPYFLPYSLILDKLWIGSILWTGVGQRHR
jgi:hypothetical protein